MNAEGTTLLMAGAREAHGLVTGLLARHRRVVASLPEPERMFEALPVPTRTGPFADMACARAWLEAQNVRLVLDASHAFDDLVCAPLRAAVQELGVPILRVLRPPWQPTSQDQWLTKPDIPTAVAGLPADACVFANTGWASLPEFANFQAKKLYLRHTGSSTRPTSFPFVEIVAGQPPFSQFEEEDLFRRLGITHLVCRNVGGAASMSKLLAARALRLPVMMIARRPAAPDVAQVETVAEALAWEAAAWRMAG